MNKRQSQVDDGGGGKGDPVPKRQRGTGSLFQFKGRVVWWCKYYRDGRAVRESTKQTRRDRAERFLKRKLAEVELGQHINGASRVRFEDLTAAVRDDYQNNARRSLARAERAIKALTETFAKQRVATITAARLATYVAARRGQGIAPATIVYELAILKRGFNLALGRDQVARVPKFPTIQVANARQGFLEPKQVDALEAELPEYLRPVLRFAVLTGWRRLEILELTWDRVDFNAGVVRLEVGTTKNADGRTFPLDALPALAASLRSQRNLTDTVEAATGKTVPWVFHRFGKPIKSHYGAWRAACTRAGVDGRMLHDCRRTAVRNLERAGVSRSVAMKLTGHRTESIFRRYAIVDEAALREGVAKLAKLGSISGSIAVSSATADGEQGA